MTQTLRGLFVLLLLAAALGKLLNMQGFFTVVAAYRVVPDATIPVLAWVLALSELALGLCLLAGWRLPAAALAVVLLHLAYLGWLSLALARGLELANCGCFGVFWPRPLNAARLAEDSVLLAAAMLFYVRVRQAAR